MITIIKQKGPTNDVNREAPPGLVQRRLTSNIQTDDDGRRTTTTDDGRPRQRRRRTTDDGRRRTTTTTDDDDDDDGKISKNIFKPCSHIQSNTQNPNPIFKISIYYTKHTKNVKTPFQIQKNQKSKIPCFSTISISK